MSDKQRHRSEGTVNPRALRGVSEPHVILEVYLPCKRDPVLEVDVVQNGATRVW